MTSYSVKLKFDYEFIRFECTYIYKNKAMTRGYYKDEFIEATKTE